MLTHLDAMYSFGMKNCHAPRRMRRISSRIRYSGRWSAGSITARPNMRAWLFTILYHVFRDRKRRIESREVQPPEEHDVGNVRHGGESRVPGSLHDSFVDEDVTRAIGSCRKSIARRWCSAPAGLRYAEIAEILDVAKGR